MFEQMDLLKLVGQRVRRLRDRLGLTGKALAEKSGLSPRFVSQLEGGQGNIAIGRLARVAAALEVGLEDLVGPEQTPGPRAQLDALLDTLEPAELERCRSLFELLLGQRQARLVALLGLRGAGKSSLGQDLAERLEIDFVELDERIEAAASLRLSELFALHGEAYYRRLEQQCLAALLAEGQPCVVALGGGIVGNPEAFELVCRHATTVWLRADPEDHMARVLAQGDQRPMAESEDAMAELRALLAAREPLYRQAQVHVDTSQLGREGSLVALERELSSQGWPTTQRAASR